ncbi:MAG: cytochrome C [Alphaproteobacteria bacterium]|nr:cytochrome C [Alphaproteobacteria bacterium]
MSTHVHRTILVGLIATATVLTASLASAANMGDPAAGRKYAEAVCSTCHSIVPSGNTSPVDEATPFQEIANTPGMTRTALIVFFRTPHPTMPNLFVQGDDADNVISYILSLKKE